MFTRSRRMLRRLWRAESVRPLPGVLSASELERSFRQERARVDRNGRCFSVAVFRVSPRSRDDLEEVAQVLEERMRSYDALGALDPERLALLLPESDGRGAWTFADDAIDQFVRSELDVDCEVFTYPLERGGRDGRGDQEQEPEAGRNAAHAEGEDDPAEAPPWRRAGGASAQSTSDAPAGTSAPGARGAQVQPRSTGTDGPAPRHERAPEAQNARRANLAALRDDQHPRPVGDLYPHFLVPLPAWRRALDIVFAGLLLALLGPLLLVTAALVKVTSPGPVLFVQWRAGRGGRPFRFYKFRSMYVDAEARKAELAAKNEMDGPVFKIRADPRITPLGRWLRKFSIDEMPQLWNVLKGDMTLVGPRPPTLDEVAAYERWQRERLDLTGGLTCIWQVSGRSEVGFEDWIRMDLEYKRRRSAAFDLRLLWRTIGAVFSGRGAY